MTAIGARCLALLLMAGAVVSAEDLRDIRTGWEIPTENYADQPYVVQTDDGAWLCILTTGVGHEGVQGQHAVTLRSVDRGRTWSAPVDVEPADGPEASYAVLLKAPTGRLYAFYNHNTDNLRQVKADTSTYKSGFTSRVDTQGYYVFKVSDDHGRTWSKQRYPIPVREFEIDRENPYGGKVRFFWNVGKPFIHAGAVYVPLHKVGRFGAGFLARTEGVLLESDNLLTASDAAQATWQTLPDGDIGLRAPAGGGPIAEEQNFSILSDGSFFCVYRTVAGHPVCAYSRDGGHTWSPPEYMRYADGRLIKHPRAANFAWKCRNGKYLYWFHNHGGRSYDDRNPAWLCGGIEADSPAGKVIQWSQPEIVLYDDDPGVRMSYPDLIEDEGDFFLTETQKTLARVHPLDRTLLEGLWNQFDSRTVAASGRVSAADGLAIELWIEFETLAPGQIVLDSRDENAVGLVLQTATDATVEIVLNDGQTEARWGCDPGLLEARRLHHIVANVDAGPKIVTFIIDGELCDGGESRQFGWGRLTVDVERVTSARTPRIAPDFNGRIHRLRLYDRYLRTSEAIGNYRAGVPASVSRHVRVAASRRSLGDGGLACPMELAEPASVRLSPSPADLRLPPSATHRKSTGP
jgi:Concanavalin A-like lectin/glucanases superfamily/BNR repeat-like domain